MARVNYAKRSISFYLRFKFQTHTFFFDLSRLQKLECHLRLLKRIMFFVVRKHDHMILQMVSRSKLDNVVLDCSKEIKCNV